jgi:hypothetical protein
MFKIKIIIMGIFCMNLLNCHSNKYYYNHSWLNSSEETTMNDINFDYLTKKEYKDEYISIWQYNLNVEIIRNEYKDHYIKLLQNNEFIEITQGEANKISFNQFYNENKKYYITRALYPLLGGIYIVNLTEKNDLFIYYAVMAKKDYKLKEDALIIEVDNCPNNIYISFSITS